MEWSGRFWVTVASATVLLFLKFRSSDGSPATTTTVPVPVGVVVNLATEAGRKSRTCISMALEDFYRKHPSYKTRVGLHVRDSRGDIVSAAHAAKDLIKKAQVQAIIGPHTSAQAEFVAYLGSRAHIPIISFATFSPTLAPSRTPFFVRTGGNDYFQALPIAAILAAFRWRAATMLYEGSPYGTGILPALDHALQHHDMRMVDSMVVPMDVNDEDLDKALDRLVSMPTRVVVVHMLPALATRLFLRAKIAGMMADSYVWIATARVGMAADSLSHKDIVHMQGVVTLRPHVPETGRTKNFTARFKARFRQENPDADEVRDPSMLLLWAYDTAEAVARAVETAHVKNFSTAFQTLPHGGRTIAGSYRPDASASGATLLHAVLNTAFDGLAGRFRLVKGELQPPAYEIVNITGKGSEKLSLWTQESRMEDIYNKKNALKIAVPKRKVSNTFVNVVTDPTTKEESITGYSIDIFEATVKRLPYPPEYEFIPYDCNGSYDKLVDMVYGKHFDAAVGDVTIMANRSELVDFTMPYTDSGVSMLVLTRNDTNPTMWIFLRPLTNELWCATVGFFFFTGLVVWIIEGPINPEFQGSTIRQFTTTFYFAFSTLTFSHEQIIKSLMSKIVVVIWCFVVLVLVQSYTASLSSMLTTRMLQPSVTDLIQLLHNGDYVGYQDGSMYVRSMLRKVGFEEFRIKAYGTQEEYAAELRRGTSKGGVSAICDEVPYLTPFLEKYGNEFQMVDRFDLTSGFGFVLPKKSPLVQDLSSAILNVTEGDEGSRIKEKWFGKPRPVSDYGGTPSATSPPITVRSFSGLFVVSGSVSIIMLLIHFGQLICAKYTELRNADSDSVHSGVESASVIEPSSVQNDSVHARFPEIEVDTG